MMDDSHSTKKGATTFVQGPEMEGSLSGGDAVSPAAGQVVQEEEIKRDLHSRHINMIAIAGMIVRVIPSSPLHSRQSQPEETLATTIYITVPYQFEVLTQDREPDFSSDPAKFSPLQVRRVLCWLTLLWV
jgi:hypothetical protein